MAWAWARATQSTSICHACQLPVVYDVDIAANKLNRDLEIISTWAYQWKMQFNPDKNKQAIQVIFSQKKDTPVHPPFFFNGSEVLIKAEDKHLGMILDSKLTF